MAAGTKAGDVHFDVHANTEPLKKEVKDANADIAESTGGGKVNAKTAAYAKAAEKELDGLGGALKDTKKRWGEQVEIVQGLIGKIVAVGAVTYTAFSTGKAITEAFIESLKTGTQRAQDFKDALDLSDVQGSLKSYDDELAKLDADMAERQSGSVLGYAKSMLKSDAALQEEINSKRTTREALARTDKAKKDSEARAKAKAESEQNAKDTAKAEADKRKSVLDDLQTARHQSELSQMDERTRTEAEANDKIKELRDKFHTLSGVDQAAYSKVFAAARLAIEEDLAAKLRKIDDENAKKQIENVKRVTDAFVSSFRSIREASNSVFNTDQAASMVQFAQQMQVSATMAHANMNRIVVEGVG